MNIRELQKELVEKISLIAIEDDGANVERALEIINQLGEDHINDTTTSMDRDLTVLDCIVICDSQGNNPRISARPRLNNQELKKLEDAIRKVGGKMSEELGLVQNNRREFFNASQTLQRAGEALRDLDHLINQIIRGTSYGLCSIALATGSFYLLYPSRDDEEFTISRSIGMVGMGVLTMTILNLVQSVRELALNAGERPVSGSLENAVAAQHDVEGRQLN